MVAWHLNEATPMAGLVHVIRNRAPLAQATCLAWPVGVRVEWQEPRRRNRESGGSENARMSSVSSWKFSW